MSIRKDIDHNIFEFPNPYSLEKRLKDFLEPHVDEKYYLSDKMVSYISAPNQKWTGNNNGAFINKDIASTLNTGEGSRRCDASNYVSEDLPDNYNLQNTDKIMVVGKSKSGGERSLILDEEGICNYLSATDYKQPKQILIKEKTKKDYSEAQDGDGVYINRPQQKRDVVQKGMIQTLKTSPDVGVVVENKSLFTETQAKMFTKDGNVKRYIDSDVVDEFKEGQCADISFPNGYNKGNRVFNEYPTINTTTTQSSFCVKVKDEIKVIGNYSPSGHHASRIVDSEGIAPTVTENHGTVTATTVNIPPLRIRKLTPKECYRLMGFDDEDFEKSESVPTSNTQLYKQAGNSICVPVLEAIFKKLLIDNTEIN